jgi:hypothetical protein
VRWAIQIPSTRRASPSETCAISFRKQMQHVPTCYSRWHAGQGDHSTKQFQGFSPLFLIHLCLLYADTGKQFDYSNRLRSQQIAIGGCLPSVHPHSRTNSARLAVYATEKSAEMPRQPHKQRRDRFRKGSMCLCRSCAGFVLVYRRRALLIPAYTRGGPFFSMK